MMKHLLTLLAALTLAVGCDKSGDFPFPKPDPEQTDQQTLLMYFPWSGNLTSFFLTNIEDMKQVVADGIPDNCRVVVFFMSNSTTGRLFELRNRKGITEERELKTYNHPAFTTAEGIAAILEDVKRLVPATRYAMSIGSHGMAWLPALPATSAASLEPAYGTQPAKEYWEHTDANGLPLTRWFGGTQLEHRTDLTTLAQALQQSKIKMEYILFDDCYMSSIEVAYDLREVTDYLIASTCEIMAYGFPYALVGKYMIGQPDYAAICQGFYDFYINYDYPCGTIAVTNCSMLDDLAEEMKQINLTALQTVSPANLQPYDGYTPHRFYDLGDYVEHSCTDAALRRSFAEQLERVIPADHRRHTPTYYSNGHDDHPINTFSGVMCSDPSTSNLCAEKDQTAWWRATH